jgi:hypothetical protein
MKRRIILLIVVGFGILLSLTVLVLMMPTEANKNILKRAEPRLDAALSRVQGWLKQFENGRQGNVPEPFCVRISLYGYLNRESHQGTLFLRPREVYEFTPQEVRRLCPRAAGTDENGEVKYRDEEKGALAYEVAARKPFAKIDEVCRILLALDYAELVRPKEDAGENFHYLQVMTDSGLGPFGGTCIRVGADGAEVACTESCYYRTSPTSAHSIRYAALYHTLRRLARSELGLAGEDWRDALDIIAVDGSVRPAQGIFRARE